MTIALWSIGVGAFLLMLAGAAWDVEQQKVDREKWEP